MTGETLQRVIPALRMTNAARSLAFYCDGLGFALDWEHRFEPGFPLFAQISRDGLVLFLSEHTGDCEPGGLVYLHVEDVDGWHADIMARGIEPLHPPQDQPWGLRELRIADPDGNKLVVCRRCQGAE